jgi:hypothetical protein
MEGSSDRQAGSSSWVRYSPVLHWKTKADGRGTGANVAPGREVDGVVGHYVLPRRPPGLGLVPRC